MNNEIKAESELSNNDSNEMMDLDQENSNQNEFDSTNNKSSKFEIDLTIEEMINAQWAFGALKKNRCSYMFNYIYTTKNGYDIIDVSMSYKLFMNALMLIKRVISRGGKILFVGTEKHTSELIEKTAYDSTQYYISKRWLGGLLTNWPVFQTHMINIKKIEHEIAFNTESLVKKDLNKLLKKKLTFDKYLSGVREMNALPSVIVTTSANEVNAIKEGAKLGIPVISLLDTSSNPQNITHPIPGNDRCMETIELFLNSISKACVAGLSDFLNKRSTQQLKTEQRKDVPQNRKPQPRVVTHFAKKIRTDRRFTTNTQDPKNTDQPNLDIKKSKSEPSKE